MLEEQLNDRPEAVTFEDGPKLVSVVIRLDISGTDEDGYTCSATRLELDKDEATDELRAAIAAAPERFVDYIPLRKRKEVENTYTTAVQQWMDITAQTRGYDDIKSAVGYENSDDPTFKAEACALRSWRDKVWRACYTYMDSVLAGEETLVSPDALLARLPQMEWPE